MDERAALDLVSDLVDAAGDDAALVGESVLTIDMLHESTDFPPGTTRYTAGWRAVGASLSDVAAMGGRAVATVAVYGAPDFGSADLTAFVNGATDVSESVGADYVGGDLDGHDEFTVATAALGHAEQRIGRDGARSGEVVCVTGTLGRSAAAMRHFETGDTEQSNELFQFPPRVEAGTTLAPHVTAMMDSSDGLARSLHQLAAASEVGFAIEGDSIPVAEELRAVTEDPETADSQAIRFGEDFELVCTMPEERIEEARSELSVPLSVVGQVTNDDAGVTIDGTPLEDEGYTHGH